MAARSADFAKANFLDPNSNEPKNAPILHRARSGGYVDHIEEKVKWERANREREMKKYHDQKHPKKRQQAESLYVPTFEPSHRRVQSHGELKDTQSPAALPYRVREVKPSDFNLSDDSDIPIRLQRRATEKEPEPQKPKRRPTVEIHQKKPRTPKASPAASPAASPRIGTSPVSATSPRSPGIPKLEFQFAALQNKFLEINTICARNFHVEPADPRDLTFMKIAEEAQSHAFNLQVWEHTVNLKSLGRIERSKRQIVEHASKTLERLFERTKELCDACATARPRDLKFEALPEVDDDSDLENEDSEDDESAKDITQSLDFEIRSHLESIGLQIRILSRLTRSLQEAAPEAEAEVDAISDLVGEVKKYFGSAEALDRYEIDTRFGGKKALDEAKHTARMRG